MLRRFRLIVRCDLFHRLLLVLSCHVCGRVPPLPIHLVKIRLFCFHNPLSFIKSRQKTRSLQLRFICLLFSLTSLSSIVTFSIVLISFYFYFRTTSWAFDFLVQMPPTLPFFDWFGLEFQAAFFTVERFHLFVDFNYFKKTCRCETAGVPSFPIFPS